MNYFLIKIALLIAAISSTTANTIDGVGSSTTSSPISFTSSGAAFLPRGGYAFLQKEATSTVPKNEIPMQKIRSNISSNKHPLLSSESAIKAAITRANRLNQSSA